MNACAGETNEERGPPMIEVQGRQLPEYRLPEYRLRGHRLLDHHGVAEREETIFLLDGGLVRF